MYPAVFFSFCPAGTPGEKQANKNILLYAVDQILEFTPGTNQHKRAYGSRWSFGTYRFTASSKRSDVL